MTSSLNNKQRFRRISRSPKLLFLIDAIGALLTAVCMLFILKPFQFHIGIPAHVLNILAVIAGGLSLYSFCCFFFLTSGRNLFLVIIGTANILYCIFTGLLLILHFETISIIGLSYFLIEIGVIISLAINEFKTAIHYDTTNEHESGDLHHLRRT